MKILFINALLFLTISSAFSQNDSTLVIDNSINLPALPSGIQLHIYKNDTLAFGKTNILKNLKNVPADMWQIAKSPFKKKNLLPLTAVAVSTGLLIWQDQNILNGVRQLSDNIGLRPETAYIDVITIGNVKAFRLPKNLNTALYQLGQGGTSIILAGGLWTYGKITHDKRAISTAYDLTETFISMGLTTQILKRISGRESPFARTVDGGRWRPLPAFSAYQNNTPRYDAFPSGHLATLVATITVLANNYPEKKWIVPVGSVVAAGCAYAMINTEVHWIGDYPLAIAVGYLSGKITTWRHKKNAPRKRFIP
ncbi:MAG: phosphatase PAP2 family protein [Ferruginibacter sp.]|nr:phosphatase PAP2 family protein [Ferruginibacter sp.]